MRINSRDFPVPPGRKFDLKKCPPRLKPVYKSKRNYHKLLESQGNCPGSEKGLCGINWLQDRAMVNAGSGTRSTERVQSFDDATGSWIYPNGEANGCQHKKEPATRINPAAGIGR